MTCHNTGMLQAYLDGEISRDQKKQIMSHLESCQTCRKNLEELQQLHFFCKEALESSDAAVDTEKAWATFEKNLQNARDRKPVEHTAPIKRKGWRTLKTKTKRLIVSGAVAAALLSSLASPQVRVEANQFLSLFRVDQFEMVTLTQNDLEEIEDWVSENQDGTLDLKGIGQLEMSKGAGEAKHFDSAQSAEQAGHPVASFNGFDVVNVSVVPASIITFTLQVEKANQLLEQLGSDHQFESSLNGKPFSIATSEAVHTDYESEGQHISYIHTRSPEINVPQGVSIEELRATLLSLPFLPENVKSQLAGIDNIESTLPIPYAETEGSEMKEVRIGDARGYAVESAEHSYLVWQENGAIHSIFTERNMVAGELVKLGEQVN